MAVNRIQSGLDSLVDVMRLGELLMLRAQLQKDVEEHASRVTSNAVREVGDADPPSYDPVEALKGRPCHTLQKGVSPCRVLT